MNRDRIKNNFKYHAPDEIQRIKYENIRKYAKEYAHFINENCPDSREKSIAITRLEETVMWANASIARNT